MSAKVIFTADPGEVIVSMVQFRGEMYVATGRRVLVWDAAAETMAELKMVEILPEIAVTGVSG